MSFKHLFPLFLLAMVLVQTACETEVDITAPYQRVPVVFGLLDPVQDTQFIMVNRTFLGVGNAQDMAQVEDSTLYEDLEAYIRWEDSGALQDSVQLQPIVIDNKDSDGLFFAPEQTVYYVPTSELDMDADIEILNDRTYALSGFGDGQRIYAETEVIRMDIGLTRPGLGTSDLDFVSTFNEEGSTYRDFEISWNSGPNGIKKRVTIFFHYTDLMMDGTTREQSVEIPFVQTNSTTNTDGEERVGDFFYIQLMTKIDEDPDVMLRAAGEVEVILTVAGEDFTTYLDIGDPLSDVGQERPRYSNVNDGDGIGILSSRSTFSRTRPLSEENQTDQDMRELVLGQYTSNLCFCDPRPGSQFDCQNSAEICQ